MELKGTTKGIFALASLLWYYSYRDEVPQTSCAHERYLYTLKWGSSCVRNWIKRAMKSELFSFEWLGYFFANLNMVELRRLCITLMNNNKLEKYIYIQGLLFLGFTRNIGYEKIQSTVFVLMWSSYRMIFKKSWIF